MEEWCLPSLDGTLWIIMCVPLGSDPHALIQEYSVALRKENETEV